MVARVHAYAAAMDSFYSGSNVFRTSDEIRFLHRSLDEGSVNRQFDYYSHETKRRNRNGW